jgi:hypothetical protein
MKVLVIYMLFVVNLCTAQNEFENDTSIQSYLIFDRIKIFPNPTSEIFFIKNGAEIDSYHLVDMQGKIIQKGDFAVQIISLIEHEKGVYFLFLGIKGEYRRYKIIKS